MPKGKSDPNAVPQSLNLPVTPELYKHLKAGAGTTAVGVYVHNLLAQQYGTPLKETVSGRRTFNSDAERNAFKEAYKTTRAELIEKLMKENADKFQAMLAEAEKAAIAKLQGEPSA